MFAIYEGPLAGVSFKNDDGEDRQTILERVWDWSEVVQLRFELHEDPEPGKRGIKAIVAVIGHTPVRAEKVIGWIPAKDGSLGRVEMALSRRGQSLSSATGVITSMGRAERGNGPIGVNVRVYVPNVRRAV